MRLLTRAGEQNKRSKLQQNMPQCVDMERATKG